MVPLSTSTWGDNASTDNDLTVVSSTGLTYSPLFDFQFNSYLRGYLKPKSGLVKFAVRLKGKNVEVRIATSLKKVGKGDEQALGIRGIE